MMSGGVEDDKKRSVVTEYHHHQPPPPPPYQGVYNYPPPPQQKPPPTGSPQLAQPYIPGFAVTSGPATEEPLPCFGLGIGWVLFILGFFLGVPWYVGAILLLCSKNRRERPGCIACAVLAVLATIVFVIKVTIAVRASRTMS